MQVVEVLRLPMKAPDDVSGLEHLIGGKDPMFLTSAGYDHQGPLEANLVAVVARP